MTAASLDGVDVALAIALGGEIDKVDDARKGGILPRDRPHRLCQMLADVPRLRAAPLVVVRPLVIFATADDAPARFRGQVKAQQRVVALGDFQRDVSFAVFLD